MSSNTTVEFGRRATPPTASEQAAAAQAEASTAKPASEALRPPAPPTPLRRSRGSRSQTIVFLNFLMSLIVFAAIVAGGVFLYAKRSFEGRGPLAADSTFAVKEGAGLNTIANNLEEGGMITSSRIFALGVGAAGKASALKAGEYEIKAGSSMRDIMDVIASGKSILASLTIPEGLTVEQAFQRIAGSDVLTGDMPAVMPPEGSLAADTQRFTRGMDRQKIIDKMMADQAELVNSIWTSRAPDLPVKDVNEFVTLASIVEKETGIASERPQVAAVFVNRLRKGMRLQSDPTILYGLFGGKGRPADRPIYQSDIEKPTPYNTYVIDGLPPGPIANPGRAALEAVAHPADSDALYFVADGSGGHVFASTLQEHNRNVAKWRDIQKQQQSGDQPAPAPQQ